MKIKSSKATAACAAKTLHLFTFLACQSLNSGVALREMQNVDSWGRGERNNCFPCEDVFINIVEIEINLNDSNPNWVSNSLVLNKQSSYSQSLPSARPFLGSPAEEKWVASIKNTMTTGTKKIAQSIDSGLGYKWSLIKVRKKERFLWNVEDEQVQIFMDIVYLCCPLFCSLHCGKPSLIQE